VGKVTIMRAMFTGTDSFNPPSWSYLPRHGSDWILNRRMVN